MSTSPVKGDAIIPPPRAPGRLGPPSGGPGHRHRRSGAISCHDLQTIMQPKELSSLNQGGSAPATPMDNEPRPFFGHVQRRTASQADFRSSPEQMRSASDNSPPRVVPRVRVGFADRVEYIRPLSTISSETESSLSTIRGGHSVSGSLSSVISMGTSSPPSARMARLPLRTTFENESLKARPQSSGDVLEATSRDKQEFRVQWNESDRPKSAVSTPSSEQPPTVAATEGKSPKRKSFSWWESKRPHHVLRSSISEPSLLPSPPTSPDSLDSPSYAALGEELSGTEAEKQNKSKKTRSWTRSLISRKSRSHGNLKTKSVCDRSATPPPPLPTRPSFEAATSSIEESGSREEETFEPNFDIDETVTIVADEPRSSLSLTPFKKRLHADSDPMSPVIDLDAALGPFNTPPFGANSRGSPAKSQPRARRSMHSLGYQSSINHRRTESAPELVPFDVRNAKIAPTPAMPDVFEEEDEEEAAQETDMASNPGSLLPSPTDEEMESAFGISMNEAAEDNSVMLTQRPEHLRPPPPVRTTSHKSLPPSVASQRSANAVEVVEDFEEPRASSFTRDSDSTITPPMTAEDEKAPRPLMNLQLPHPQQPIMTPDTLTASSFSSRQFSNSQVSLSTPRLGTATSSTDNRSIRFGEPGPAVRMSYDDVPSLSSSRSTMTTPPQYPFMFANSYGPGSLSDGRKSSVASIPSLDGAQRRSKRASVASLSRLVGVKSKLSIETRPQSQHIMSTTMSTNKTKKSNRLSKLMHFWKKQPSEARRGSLA
jgi:hypothetical protein